jgi:hypothetical protein
MQSKQASDRDALLYSGFAQIQRAQLLERDHTMLPVGDLGNNKAAAFLRSTGRKLVYISGNRPVGEGFGDSRGHGGSVAWVGARVVR